MLIKSYVNMHNSDVSMQKKMINIKKKHISLINTLKFFTLNKEGTIEQVASFIGRDYTTAARRIRKLENRNLIKLERLERTNRKGKERKIYRIMLRGLFIYMRIDVEVAFSKFDEIAKAHSDKLLTFKKWEYLKKKGLGALIKKRFLSFLVTSAVADFILFIFTTQMKGKPSFPRMSSDVNTGKATDADILGILHLMHPPESLKQTNGWPEIMKLLKAVEEDYELRMFKGEIIFWLKKQSEEYLKALEQWKAL